MGLCHAQGNEGHFRWFEKDKIVVAETEAVERYHYPSFDPRYYPVCLPNKVPNNYENCARQKPYSVYSSEKKEFFQQDLQYLKEHAASYYRAYTKGGQGCTPERTKAQLQSLAKGLLPVESLQCKSLHLEENAKHSLYGIFSPSMWISLFPKLQIHGFFWAPFDRSKANWDHNYKASFIADSKRSKIYRDPVVDTRATYSKIKSTLADDPDYNLLSPFDIFDRPVQTISPYLSSFAFDERGPFFSQTMSSILDRSVYKAHVYYAHGFLMDMDDIFVLQQLKINHIDRTKLHQEFPGQEGNQIYVTLNLIPRVSSRTNYNFVDNVERSRYYKDKSRLPSVSLSIADALYLLVDQRDIQNTCGKYGRTFKENQSLSLQYQR
ncbi:MAG: hypothetical protein KDD52_05775, partial [Bdellovibrionales bacterium]|nr:hypothetical protein [Bdellovibrionales bacterium]